MIPTFFKKEFFGVVNRSSIFMMIPLVLFSLNPTNALNADMVMLMLVASLTSRWQIVSSCYWIFGGSHCRNINLIWCGCWVFGNIRKYLIFLGGNWIWPISLSEQLKIKLRFNVCFDHMSWSSWTATAAWTSSKYVA